MLSLYHIVYLKLSLQMFSDFYNNGETAKVTPDLSFSKLLITSNIYHVPHNIESHKALK